MINVDEMIKEYNKELVEEYPFLLPRNVWTDELDKDYDYSYTLLDCVPIGWMDLFLQMCEDLKKQLIKDNFLYKFRFSQIKEKYGKLCLYNFGCSDKAQRILDNYSYVSGFVCYNCGEPAKQYSVFGYFLPYCKSCIKEEKKGVKKEYHKNPRVYIKAAGHKYRKYLKITKYRCSHVENIKINTKDIWDRLYDN